MGLDAHIIFVYGFILNAKQIKKLRDVNLLSKRKTLELIDLNDTNEKDGVLFGYEYRPSTIYESGRVFNQLYDMPNLNDIEHQIPKDDLDFLVYIANVCKTTIKWNVLLGGSC
jgi:hypothetical protein